MKDQVLHENGKYWVRDELYGYVVYENGITHAVSVQAFPLNEDGLSLAMAYCDYIADKNSKKVRKVYERKGNV